MYATLDEYRSFIAPRRREGYKEDSTWLVLQYDTRPLTEIDKAFVDRNRAYCQRHGYDYQMVTEDDGTMPPYWTKVSLAQRRLKMYKGVMWLDTDAVIVSETAIESLVPKDKHMLFAPDAPLWALRSPFNAGVWMVRNTEQGHSIMNQWMERYDPNQWYKEGASWRSNGIWAGDTYEQGAFSSFVLPNVKNWVHSADWTLLQGVKKTDQAFSLHFSDNQKSLRQSFLGVAHED